jgi:hypothetical protein
MNDIITNGTEIKQRIVSEINNSKQIVYLAMAFFTDRDIANAIIGAKKRNVTIDIILSSNAQNETVKQIFREANINVHAFDTGDERGMMHHKFCLIDNVITINGSYNYSYNASNNNVENIHISDDYSIYKQFLTEFERLKYNIDNRMDMNSTILMPEIKTEQVETVNIIDTFFQQLHNLVYSSAEINAEEYKKKGKENSKESQGNIDIFRTEYTNIKEEIKAYATDEGLSSKKNILTSNISNAFESIKTNLNAEMQVKTTVALRSNDLEKRQITDKTINVKQEKSLLESGNENTGEKGLLQINKENEKNKLERKSLEQSLVVKELWSFGTIVVAFLLFIFTCYLSVFFASAFYKMLFEGDVIRKSLEAGINPGLPKLVDANAIIKIFRQQGVLFGFIAAIFFLFPILLSNIKLLGSENKLVNNTLFWVGLVIFDVIVAGMIAINTDELKSLLVGKESQLAFWEVVKQGEFWMIFMFGMVPLIISHFLIENLTNAYKKSKRELVDAEKNRKIQILDEEIIDINASKELITNRIKEKDDVINENKSKILSLETEINNIQNQIENKYLELQKQIKATFDDFNAKIISGKIFTDVILDSVISAYKSGFIEFLPEYYSADEVAIRVREIEQVITNKQY